MCICFQLGLVMILTGIVAQGAQSASPAAGQWSEQAIREMVTQSAWASDVAVGGTGRRVTVRWESAAPVVEACMQGGMEKYLFSCASKLLYLSGLSKKFDEMLKRYYVLSVSPYPKDLALGDGPQPPEHSAEANAVLAGLGARIKQATQLIAGAGKAMNPVDVVVLPAGESLLVLLFFERLETMAPGAGSVVFESRFEAVPIRAEFSLAEMVYLGKPAL